MIDLEKVTKNWDFELQKQLEEDRKTYYEFLWQFYPIFDKEQKLCVHEFHLDRNEDETVYEGIAFDLFSDVKFRRVTNLKVLDMFQSNAEKDIIIILTINKEE